MFTYTELILAPCLFPPFNSPPRLGKRLLLLRQVFATDRPRFIPGSIIWRRCSQTRADRAPAGLAAFGPPSGTHPRNL